MKDRNIPINKDLLNKYENVTDLINDNLNNYDGKVNVKSNIKELKGVKLDEVNNTELFYIAKNIFHEYNQKNEYINDGNIIKVSNKDIKESIEKITHNINQKELLKEHLQVFSDLGDIIESAILVSQGIEQKNEIQKTHMRNKVWNYYLNGLKINNNYYLFEFDVISRSDGENHYRVQRLQKQTKTDASAGSIANSNTAPTLETSALDSL